MCAEEVSCKILFPNFFPASTFRPGRRLSVRHWKGDFMHVQDGQLPNCSQDGQLRPWHGAPLPGHFIAARQMARCTAARATSWRRNLSQVTFHKSQLRHRLLRSTFQGLRDLRISCKRQFACRSLWHAACREFLGKLQAANCK